MDNRNDFITFLLGADTNEGYEKLLKIIGEAFNFENDMYEAVISYGSEILIDRNKEYHGITLNAKILRVGPDAIYLALFIDNNCIYCDYIMEYEQYLEKYV